jgi:hypothetical protein
MQGTVAEVVCIQGDHVMAMSAAQVYEEHIKTLSVEDRLQLLALIAEQLASERRVSEQGLQHSLMELHGLGKDVWVGLDAQEYVNRLRDEWHDETA